VTRYQYASPKFKNQTNCSATTISIVQFVLCLKSEHSFTKTLIEREKLTKKKL